MYAESIPLLTVKIKFQELNEQKIVESGENKEKEFGDKYQKGRSRKKSDTV